MQELTLEALYGAHAKTVYWAAYGVLRDPELARDVLQNVFLSAHRNMQMLAGLAEEQCRAWLYRCAVNGGIDVLRRNKRSIPVENVGALLADKAPGPEAEAESNEIKKAVRKALNELPEKYRQPLYLYYFAELPYHEIATILKMNEGTLKSRMSRGRAMMGQTLREGGGQYAEK